MNMTKRNQAGGGYLAVVLAPADPDCLGPDGGDGGAVAGAVLPLHVDRLAAPEPGKSV